MKFSLFQLPPDVVGANVLVMIGCVDLVNLDSAACAHKIRHELLNAFSRTQLVDLRDSTESSRYSNNPIIWKWFWKRGITIKGMEVHQDELADVEQNAHLTASPVTIFCDSPSFNHGLTNSLSECPALCGKLSHLVLGDNCVRELITLIPHMPCLTSIVDERAFLTEQGAIQLLHPSLHLAELNIIFSDTSSILLEAILPMGPTLRSLAISTSTLGGEHFQLIAQHCPHLTSFHFHHYYNYNLVANVEKGGSWEAGIAAIAKGCHDLQGVQVWKSYRADDAILLLFAAHCFELRKISLTTITDEALELLTQNCQKLVDISGDWAVHSHDTVARATAWLSRLTNLEALQSHDTQQQEQVQQTFSVALTHLRNVESLRVESGVLVSEAALSSLATRCTRLRELKIASRGSAATEAHIERIVRNNPRLESICIAISSTDCVWLTDAVVEAIAESCPRLRTLDNLAVAGQQKQAPSVLTDRAILKLAKSCRRLRYLAGC